MPDEEDPTVPIECEACGTSSRVPLSDLAEALERHNEQRHGGAERARVDPALADELADLVAEDMGLTD